MLSALATNTSLTCLHLGGGHGGGDYSGWAAALARGLPQNRTLRDLRLYIECQSAQDTELIFGALGGSGGLPDVLPSLSPPVAVGKLPPGLRASFNGLFTLDAAALAALGVSLSSGSGRLEALSLKQSTFTASQDGANELCETISGALVAVGEASRLHELQLADYRIDEKGAGAWFCAALLLLLLAANAGHILGQQEISPAPQDEEDELATDPIKFLSSS